MEEVSERSGVLVYLRVLDYLKTFSGARIMYTKRGNGVRLWEQWRSWVLVHWGKGEGLGRVG